MEIKTGICNECWYLLFFFFLSWIKIRNISYSVLIMIYIQKHDLHTITFQKSAGGNSFIIVLLKIELFQFCWLYRLQLTSQRWSEQCETLRNLSVEKNFQTVSSRKSVAAVWDALDTVSAKCLRQFHLHVGVKTLRGVKNLSVSKKKQWSWESDRRHNRERDGDASEMDDKLLERKLCPWLCQEPFGICCSANMFDNRSSLLVVGFF